jgi:hypothetical protein
MFRAAHRSLSGDVFAASGLHTHVVTGCSQVCVGTGFGIVPVITDQVVTCVCDAREKDFAIKIV